MCTHRRLDSLLRGRARLTDRGVSGALPDHRLPLAPQLVCHLRCHLLPVLVRLHIQADVDEHVEGVISSSRDTAVARARAYALLKRYNDAEIDLTNALRIEPTHASALRYRADARRHQGNLSLAKSDIEAALRADPNSVETAILRGEINEALRLKVRPKTGL